MAAPLTLNFISQSNIRNWALCDGSLAPRAQAGVVVAGALTPKEA
jgi:hypothetical protein